MQLHRFILDNCESPHIDHIDGNGLNCRRDNMRPATYVQNQMNRSAGIANYSGFKGVSWNKKDKRWWAQISLDGKRKYLGGFHDPVKAAMVYDRAALAAYGEFARVNFP